MEQMKGSYNKTKKKYLRVLDQGQLSRCIKNAKEYKYHSYMGKDSFILLSKISLYIAADITSSIGHMMPYSSQPFS